MKPEIMRRSVDKAVELGISMSSFVFIHAVGVLACTRNGIWEVRLQNFHECGFSDDDVLTMFRKQPMSFLTSGKKVKKIVELLLAMGKYNVSNIVNNSSSLGCSIERRLEPRLLILGVLESRNLIGTWSSFSRIYQCKDDEFYDVFIWPYYDEIGKEHITRYESRDKADEVVDA